MTFGMLLKVDNVFSNEQKDIIINQLKITNLSLNLAGDGHSDSPGHNAKYGLYSILECQINKVLDVQVVQSTEVANSNACELEGLKGSLDVLEEKLTSVLKFLRTEKNYIRHLFMTFGMLLKVTQICCFPHVYMALSTIQFEPVNVHKRMNYLFDEFRKDPKEMTKSLTEYVDHIPEPLCSKFEWPSWDNIKRLTRISLDTNSSFSSSSTPHTHK
ncbi:hypothetical protein BgiMline_020930 [Biomphalaria glabrata]